MVVTRVLAFALAALLPFVAAAQPYPNKPIRLVVPFPAGGSVDILARIMGQKFTEAWGRPAIVENRAGGSSNIGAEFVAKWTAEGGAVPAALAAGATRKRADSPC
ncbi:MAG TPA: hypothetical protein VLN59_06240 [Burkholderiales bacterium]|nr:hypothetical protein [Burkholderiales bacterium]